MSMFLHTEAVMLKRVLTLYHILKMFWCIGKAKARPSYHKHINDKVANLGRLRSQMTSHLQSINGTARGGTSYTKFPLVPGHST